MHIPIMARRGRWMAALGIAGWLAAAGCESDPAAVDVTRERLLYRIAFAADGQHLPRARFDLRLGLLLMDLSVPDAFSRATGDFGTYTMEPAVGGRGFNIAAALRNGTQDRRAPGLVASGAAPGSYLRLFNPNFTGVGAGYWNLWGSVTGLKPNTVYTVALARMALAVRGQLDHAAVLVGASEQPDSLYYLGGAPGGNSATVQCNFTAAVAVNAERNPAVIGFVVTNGSGSAVVDCVPVASGTSPWWRDASSELPAGAADSIPWEATLPALP